MAIWQVDFYIVSEEKYTRNVNLEEDTLYEWREEDVYIEKINFLGKGKKGWSEDIIIYGEEDGTCIRFSYWDNTVEIMCRLDLRSIACDMLIQILQYIQQIYGLIFYDGEFYSPDLNAVLPLLKNSPANRFCSNPEKFIEELSQSI